MYDALLTLFCTIAPTRVNRYDLKGSLAGRRTSDKACKQGAVQKDLNLMESGNARCTVRSPTAGIRSSCRALRCMTLLCP
jgi:hypothetical protein